MDGAPDRLPELNHWHQQLSRNLHELTSDLEDFNCGQDVSCVLRMKSGCSFPLQAVFYIMLLLCGFEPQCCLHLSSGSRDLAVWPWAGPLASLSSSPHSCNTGMARLILQRED